MAKKKQTKKAAEKALHVELVGRMIALSTSGFGFVAALAWNNLVQEFINNYVKRFLPSGSGILSLLIYALAITALAVFVTFQLAKLQKAVEKE